MSSDKAGKSRERAVEQLKSLGLSTYAARMFVALVGLRDGTAQDVSDVAEVPRTRVYDTAEELETLGLIEIQETAPKRFWAASIETAERQFRREHSRCLSTLADALDVVEPDQPPDRQPSVRTVTGEEAVANNVTGLVDSATEEVVYLSAPGLLGGEIVDSLGNAAERGAGITVSDHPPAVSGAVRDVIPDVNQFESPLVRPGTPIGRLLVVDRAHAILSVVNSGAEATGGATDGGTSPDTGAETAILGTGAGNGLVAVLEQLL